MVTIGEDGVTVDDLLVHDEHAEDPYLAFMLSRLSYPEFPVPVGVFRSVDHPTHDKLMQAQIDEARAKSGEGDLEALLNDGETWVAS